MFIRMAAFESITAALKWAKACFQKTAQVAAEEFGVSINAIKITATDTAKVPNTSATAASSGSDLNGMAIKVACEKIKSRMAAHLAAQYNKSPDDVAFTNERGSYRAGACYPLAMRQRPVMNNVSVCRRRVFIKRLT